MASEKEIRLFINFIEDDLPAGDYDTYVNELKKRNKELHQFLRCCNAYSFISGAFTWAGVPCINNSWAHISGNWQKKLCDDTINEPITDNCMSIW